MNAAYSTTWPPDLWTERIGLSHKSAFRLLDEVHSPSPFYYYSARKLIFILPSYGG